MAIKIVTAEFPTPLVDLWTVLVHAAAGTVGGVLGIYTGSPFDVVKLRMQLSRRNALSLAGELWKAEGFRGFFRGAAAISLGQAPVNAVIFASNAAALRYLEHSAGALPGAPAAFSSLVAAGCTSGLAQAFVLSPFEHVKIQQQAAGGASSLSFGACSRAIVAALGPSGLFRGLIATCIRDAPTFGLYFSSYEAAKRAGSKFLGLVPDTKPPASVLLSSGAFAGAASWAVALPADVVKSIIQGAPLNTPKSNLKWLTVAKRVYSGGGAVAFFRGFLPCVLRSLPVNAVTFYGYELVLSEINLRFPASM